MRQLIKISSAVYVVVALLLLLSPSALKAEQEFRLDLVHGGKWYDAEKSKDNKGDDWLCWASSAANVLAWSGWGAGAGFSTEDEIFQYYSSHWNDHPAGSPRAAWKWFFTGESSEKKTGARVIREGGGFWKRADFPDYKWKGRKGDLFRGIGKNKLKRDPYVLRQLLEEGYGVALQIVTMKENGDRDSHMVTLWGFRSDLFNRFKGILITDSDDGKMARSAEKAENKLVYYPVELKDKFWWFEYKGNQWKILAAYALLAKEKYLR